MTTRLMYSTFGAGSYEPARAALRRDRAGDGFEIRGASLRVGAVALFRRLQGGVHQAVRAQVLSGQADDGLQVELTAPDGTVHRATCVGGRADVWVPEVDAVTPFEVSIAGTPAGRVVVEPQRKWTVHAVQHSHLDIGYTDPQGVVLRNHLSYLDAVLALVDATDDRPDDAQFRWTVESSLPMSQWLSRRPKPTVDRMLRRIREGRVEVTALPFQLHTEACSQEELRRVVANAVELRERFGIDIASAMHTDVPGAVTGVVDALSEAGVRYLSAAHNWAGRSVPYLTGGTKLSRPFWWRSAAGNRIMVWFTDTAHGMAYMEGNLVGFSAGYELVDDLLPSYLDGLANRATPYGSEVFGWTPPLDAAVDERLPYEYDVVHLRVQGAHADNACPNALPSDIVRQWNETYLYPRLRISTSKEFFTDVEQRYGDHLPEFSGDWGDWWADGLASGARALGWTRRAQNRLRSAETLHAWADLRNGENASPIDELADAHEKVALFDEHTWGAANPWHDSEEGADSGQRQWVWKQSLAQHGNDDAYDLLESAATRIAATYDGGRTSVLVANTGPAARCDVARVFIPASDVPLDRDIVVVDAEAGAPALQETAVVRPNDRPTKPAGRQIRFLARDVQAVGLKSFEISEGTPPESRPLLRDGGTITLESTHYRLVADVERGVVDSIVHLPSQHELINQSSIARFNDYVYERYATAPHVNHLSGHVSAHGLELLAERGVAATAVVKLAERTPLCDRLVIQRFGPGVDLLETTIELPKGVDRIDIANRLVKKSTSVKESIYFAFPLNATAPGEWELTGGVGGPEIDSVPGGAQHMRCVRHWVGFQERSLPDGAELAVAWATLEAPLIQVGELHLPYSPFPTTVTPEPAEPATIWSWALNNIWDTNFPSQQAGEMTFHYAIGARGGASARQWGTQLAAGLTDPFVTAVTCGAEPVNEALASVDDPEIFVSTVGRARDGVSFAVRLRSVAPDAREVTVRLPAFAIGMARIANSAELDIGPAEVRGDGSVVVRMPAEGMRVLLIAADARRDSAVG